MTVSELFEELLKASPTFEDAINNDNYDVVGNVLVHILCGIGTTQVAGIRPQESGAMRDVVYMAGESLVTKLACALFPDYLDKLPRSIVEETPIYYQAYAAYKKGVKNIDISTIQGARGFYIFEGAPEIFFDSVKGLKDGDSPLAINLPNAIADDVYYEDADIHIFPSIRAKTLHIKITSEAEKCEINQAYSPIADMIEIEGDGFPKNIRSSSNSKNIKAIKFVPTADCHKITLKQLDIKNFGPDFKLYVPEGLKVEALKIHAGDYKKVLVRY